MIEFPSRHLHPLPSAGRAAYDGTIQRVPGPRSKSRSQHRMPGTRLAALFCRHLWASRPLREMISPWTLAVVTGSPPSRKQDEPVYRASSSLPSSDTEWLSSSRAGGARQLILGSVTTPGEHAQGRGGDREAICLRTHRLQPVRRSWLLSPTNL
jgi:hypothetical protein